MDLYEHSMVDYVNFNGKFIYSISEIQCIMKDIMRTVARMHSQKISHGRIDLHYILIKNLFNNPYSIALAGFGKCSTI